MKFLRHLLRILPATSGGATFQDVAEDAVRAATWGSSKLSRERIWHPEPPYYPKTRTEFAAYARPGYVGNARSVNAPVLVGSNPYSAENSTASRWADDDREHIPLLRAFIESGSEKDFGALMNFEGAQIQRWALDWAISGSLDRLQLQLNQTSVLNVIPFSTPKAPRTASPAWKNSVALHFKPLIDALQPKLIVWLGRAAQEAVRPHFRLEAGQREVVVSRQRNLPIAERFGDLDRKRTW